MDSQTQYDDGVLLERAQHLEVIDRFYAGVKFPVLLARVKALLIDALILLSIFTAASLILDKLESTPDWVRGFIYIFMAFLYDPILTSMTGGTLGHKMIGIKVKRYSQPDMNISFPMALFRFLIKGSLGWLSFLTVTSNEHKRALHDKFSGSIVLYKNA
jgi:uncharacterized RDD family membrane protein YckC